MKDIKQGIMPSIISMLYTDLNWLIWRFKKMLLKEIWLEKENKTLKGKEQETLRKGRTRKGRKYEKQEKNTI